MKPEEIPHAYRALLDKAAGKEHSTGGPVMTCLAEILTAHERAKDLAIQLLRDELTEVMANLARAQADRDQLRGEVHRLRDELSGMRAYQQQIGP